MSNVAVSIVTYHTDTAELSECLRSLTSHAVGRITIVDNGREERIHDYLKKEFPEVTYIPHDNDGFGAGHNVAINRSLAEDFTYHLVLNSDVRFDPSVIDRITNFMDSHPDVGCLQPKILNPDGTPQFTVRALPTPADLILRRFLPERFGRKARDRYLLKHLDHNKTFNVPYHQGSFMFLRTAALRDVGIFDTRYFMYPEDIDLTRRIHRKWRTLYFPDVAVIHDHRAASYKSPRMLLIHLVNMARYFNKWGWLFDSERRKINALLYDKAAKGD